MVYDQKTRWLAIDAGETNLFSRARETSLKIERHTLHLTHNFHIRITTYISFSPIALYMSYLCILYILLLLHGLLCANTYTFFLY